MTGRGFSGPCGTCGGGGLAPAADCTCTAVPAGGIDCTTCGHTIPEDGVCCCPRWCPTCAREDCCCEAWAEFERKPVRHTCTPRVCPDCGGAK